MKKFIVTILIAQVFILGFTLADKTLEKVNIHIKAKSTDNINPIYIQIMEFGDDRKFIEGDNGKFNLELFTDKIYSVYVGQKGQQTYLFNINTHIQEMLVGNFSFSIDVSLSPRVEGAPTKRVHDIEIISDEDNKPTLHFKKKN